MKNLIIAGLFVLMFNHIPAMAQDEPTASPCAGKWSEIVPKIAAHGLILTELSDDLRNNVETNLNAIPPKSNDHLTHVYVASSSDPNNNRKILFPVSGDDCGLGMIPVTPELFKRLTKSPSNASNDDDQN